MSHTLAEAQREQREQMNKARRMKELADGSASWQAEHGKRPPVDLKVDGVKKKKNA